MTAVEDARVGRTRWTTRQRLAGFVGLTKPRIIELLLMTTVPTMMLAQRGLPPLWLLGATLVGGSLAAGSANALNCYLDRDIDMRMHRTGKRPLVTGVVWIGQGLNLIPGSFMTGNRTWFAIGLVAAVVGVVLIAAGARRRRR